jgi:hypothetical protein
MQGVRAALQLRRVKARCSIHNGCRTALTCAQRAAVAQGIAMDIKLIRAFIASPGGLEDERRAAYAAAEEINRSVARQMGGRLELIGWEETLSGIGRPQATINADMEGCDLFIGAMWTTWGSKPSLDGPYSSGFEEEFELSRLRHAETGSPTMAMFFKSVDPLQLKDPGEDLKKVLAFQEKLRAQRTFLYSTFAGADDFSAKVRDFLSRHVIRILLGVAPAREERPVEAAPRAEAAAQGPTAADEQESPSAKFLVETAEELRTREGAGAVNVGRLRLIAISAGKSENDKQTLGVHDANLVYEARGRFDLAFMEKRSLLETGLGGLEDENVPVWTWLADLTENQPDLLIGLTLFGETAERAGAINAMRMLKVAIQEIPFLKKEVVPDYWLARETHAAVRHAALQYLRELGDANDLPAVKAEVDLAATETATAALAAAVAILLRQGDQEAIQYLLDTSFEKLDPVLQYRTLRQVSQLSLQDLQRGLDHRSPDIRAAVLLELGESSAIDLKTLTRARSDESSKVRYAALRALDRLGQSPSLDEAQKILTQPGRAANYLAFLAGSDTAAVPLFESYRAERMRSMSQAALEALLGAPEHRDAAYQALAARRLGDYGAKMRIDLRDGFRRYFAQHWPDGIKPGTGSSLASTLLSIGQTDPADVKKRELIRTALDIVAQQRDASDLVLVRDTLDLHGVSPSITVIALLKILGAAEDIARLAQASPFTLHQPDDGDYRREFDEAARVMLKMHRSGFAGLLGLDMPERMRAQLIDTVSATEFAKLGDEIIVGLLLGDHLLVRRSTARKIPASLSRKRVGQLLKAYREDPEGRFYVVTHWLDLGLAYDRPAARRVVSASRSNPI